MHFFGLALAGELAANVGAPAPGIRGDVLHERGSVVLSGDDRRELDDVASMEC